MDMTPINTLIPGLVHRPTELGRIRLGYRAQRNGKEYPARLDKFRLTSSSADLLAAAATLYGGEVRPWKDAPDEGYHELYTESRALDILIPTTLRTVSQAYELWEGATCQRRCDGITEQYTDGPCLCDADARRAGADGTCELMTRLSIMLPRVPGLGVWRLDTGGYLAATSIPATIELIRAISGDVPWMPAILRAEQRSKKVRTDAGTETHRFVVPVIDAGVTVAELVGEAMDMPRLEATVNAPAKPQTAREKVAARRAAIEDNGPAGEASAPPPARATGVSGSAAVDQPSSTTAGPSPDQDEPLPPEPVARALCGASPPADGLEMSQPCRLVAGHTAAHRSAEGSWPASRAED